MSKTFAYILGILITIILGIYLYLSYCSECQPVMDDSEVTVTQAVAEEPAPDPTSFPFSVEHGDFNLEVNDNFNFDRSNPSFNLPVSNKVENGIAQLQSHLDNNPIKVVNITGYYRSDEANGTAFPNLGMARANAVKNYLVSKGIASSQTNINGSLMDDYVDDNGVLKGPIAYEMTQLAENQEELLNALRTEIIEDPLLLYFNTGEASIVLDAQQRQKIARIANYLDKVEDAKCLVTGHSDNVGSRATNIRLGQERADFAKAYLIQNGIPEDRIVTNSKGPDEPISSNNNDEGKAKNRRVEISLN